MIKWRILYIPPTPFTTHFYAHSIPLINHNFSWESKLNDTGVDNKTYFFFVETSYGTSQLSTRKLSILSGSSGNDTYDRRVILFALLRRIASKNRIVIRH